MPINIDDIFGKTETTTVEVTVPGVEKTILLRYPNFKEWHEIVIAHRECGEAKTDPPAELITKTIAVCMSDSKGNRKLTDDEANEVMRAQPGHVMALYQKCFETVLKDNEAEIQKKAKKSRANRA